MVARGVEVRLMVCDACGEAGGVSLKSFVLTKSVEREASASAGGAKVSEIGWISVWCGLADLNWGCGMRELVLRKHLHQGVEVVGRGVGVTI